ncbi:SDR family NAD(P)-dependent oxidoreductase [Ferrimonas gelatinilytica]
MTTRIMITGAGSGLGRALARHWKEHRLLLTDLDGAAVATVAEEINSEGGRAIAMAGDITDRYTWHAQAHWLDTHWGGLDWLVNNAGIATAGGFATESLEQWRTVMEVDLLGAVQGCQVMAPLLRKSGGAILNIASSAGLQPMPRMGSYCAAKAALVSFSESLKLELWDAGVSVSVACPAFFKTALGDRLRSSDPAMAPILARLFERAPMTADEVAAQIAHQFEQQEFLIVPHPATRKALRLRRWLPLSRYLTMLASQTARLRNAT